MNSQICIQNKRPEKSANNLRWKNGDVNYRGYKIVFSFIIAKNAALYPCRPLPRHAICCALKCIRNFSLRCLIDIWWCYASVLHATHTHFHTFLNISCVCVDCVDVHVFVCLCSIQLGVWAATIYSYIHAASLHVQNANYICGYVRYWQWHNVARLQAQLSLLLV